MQHVFYQNASCSRGRHVFPFLWVDALSLSMDPCTFPKYTTIYEYLLYTGLCEALGNCIRQDKNGPQLQSPYMLVGMTHSSNYRSPLFPLKTLLFGVADIAFWFSNTPPPPAWPAAYWSTLQVLLLLQRCSEVSLFPGDFPLGTWCSDFCVLYFKCILFNLCSLSTHCLKVLTVSKTELLHCHPDWKSRKSAAVSKILSK